MKNNIELSREALKAFNCDNIDGLTVTIGGVSPDEKKQVYIWEHLNHKKTEGLK